MSKCVCHLNGFELKDAKSRRNIKDLQNQVSANTSRLTLLSSLEEGTTSADAEIMDARIGFDGVKYGSVGQAIRTQVGELDSYFTKSKNKIKAFIEGEALASTGAFVTGSTFKRTDYIFLLPGTYVYSNETGKYANFKYGLYDLNKAFSTYRAGEENTVITLTESMYIVITDMLSIGNNQLEEGSTPTEYEPYKVKLGVDFDSAEITGARTGFNGINYRNLGEAIRTQVGELDSYFTKSKNKIKGFIEGEALASTGAFVTGSTFKRTDYILLPAGIYVYSNESGQYNNFRYGLYDLNKAFSKYRAGEENTVITLTESMYIVITDMLSIGNNQLEEGSTPTEYEPYIVYVDSSEQIKTHGFKKKTILFNGDSITAGTGFTGEKYSPEIYPNIVAKELGMNVVNKALGGSALASNPENDTRYPLVLRYENDTTEADIVYIAIGTNDWAYGYTPVGTMEDRVTTTFYGALHILCEGLINKYPNATIIFATPIKRRLVVGDTTPNSAIRNGKTLKEYGEIIKEVCDYYSIPVIDMYSECSITPFVDSQRDKYFQETNGAGTHPNAEGQKVMARRVVAGLRNIIGF